MTIRTWATRAALVGAACTMTVVAGTAGSATAGVKVPQPKTGSLGMPGVELSLAIAETNLAMSLAAADGALLNAAAAPNISCGNPVPVGAAVTPGADTLVAVVKGSDVAEAEGQCVSLTGQSFTVAVWYEVEYRAISGGWVSAGCTGSGSGRSIAGVGVAVAEPRLCAYAPGAASAGRPHRVHAYLTNDVSGGLWEGYSEPWQG